MKTFALTQLDFYKTGHKEQYPDGTEYVYSNLTARSGKLSNVELSRGIYFVGLQLFVKDFLMDCWDDTFFNKPKEEVIERYRKTISAGIGNDIDTKHIEQLHDLGYLPIKVKALPEGSFVPYKVPMLTIVNTHPGFFWLTNMLESVMSAELWQPICSATTYKQYQKVFEDYAELTCDDNSMVNYQAHDFSYRGMAGREAAAKSSFASIAMGSKGTDSVPGIDVAAEYYGAHGFVAGSVNATEHSVMCAGGIDDEIGTFKRLITKTYPDGVISIVSDTWDFWKVVTEYLPSLKDIIMKRDGKVVIRPDSGDPVDIICGIYLDVFTDPNSNLPSEAEEKGLIECLWDTFGGTINSKGYKVLDSHIGAIYGDSITLERQSEILRRLKAKGFASSNIILGVGSYTYQYVTRDTHGMAMKATSVTINGKRKDIFKSPKTDDGTKKSATGLLMVTKSNGRYELLEKCCNKEEKRGCLEDIFVDGKLAKEYTLNEVIANSML